MNAGTNWLVLILALCGPIGFWLGTKVAVERSRTERNKSISNGAAEMLEELSALMSTHRDAAILRQAASNLRKV